MDDFYSQKELEAKLADETLRANALAAELEAMRGSPSWQAVELMRLKGKGAQKLAAVFRSVAVFFLRLVPGYGLRSRFDKNGLLRAKEVIQASKLFDPDWYAQQNSDAAADPATHFLQMGAHADLDPGPLFETGWYRRTNPDIGTQNPLLHFLEVGAGEGRCGWSTERVLTVQKPYFLDCGRALTAASNQKSEQAFPRMRAGQRVQVFANSKGNSFFLHIRDMVCRGLAQAGVAAEIADETTPISAGATTPIIIAPHEFFYLGAGVKLVDDPILSHGICVNTEQIQTPWFARAFPFLTKAAGILDFCVQNAALVADMGLPVRFLNPGFLANDPVLGLQDKLPDESAIQSFGDVILGPPPVREAALNDRPIDILFVGAQTPRRARFFADAASVLADKKCVIQLTDMSRPIIDGGGVGVSALAYAGLSQRAKIQLNIHQGVLPYFEWHRMTWHGFWHRTAVVAETGFCAPGYKPGQHFFEDDLEKLPQLIDWLLKSKDGGQELERVASNGYRQLRVQAPMGQVLADIFQIEPSQSK
ncbi:MAG: hypothetical protein COA47_06280 [Robiginitomaculum sp.]|nr:MAG: hypothetical protein COA47_06280 [Robiginitomaculum sp.]